MKELARNILLLVIGFILLYVTLVVFVNNHSPYKKCLTEFAFEGRYARFDFHTPPSHKFEELTQQQKLKIRDMCEDITNW